MGIAKRCIYTHTCKINKKLRKHEVQTSRRPYRYKESLASGVRWPNGNENRSFEGRQRREYSAESSRDLQARLRRSQILRVRSWLPVTTLDGSPRNLAAITFAQWPVRVCCNRKEGEVSALYASIRSKDNEVLYSIYIGSRRAQLFAETLHSLLHRARKYCARELYVEHTHTHYRTQDFRSLKYWTVYTFI